MTAATDTPKIDDPATLVELARMWRRALARPDRDEPDNGGAS